MTIYLPGVVLALMHRADVVTQYVLATLLLALIMSVSGLAVWAVMMLARRFSVRCERCRWRAATGVAMVESDQDWTHTTTVRVCASCLRKDSSVIEFWTWDEWYRS